MFGYLRHYTLWTSARYAFQDWRWQRQTRRILAGLDGATAGIINYSGRKLGAAGSLDTFGVIPNGYHLAGE